MVHRSSGVVGGGWDPQVLFGGGPTHLSFVLSLTEVRGVRVGHITEDGYRSLREKSKKQGKQFASIGRALREAMDQSDVVFFHPHKELQGDDSFDIYWDSLVKVLESKGDCSGRPLAKIIVVPTSSPIDVGFFANSRTNAFRIVKSDDRTDWIVRYKMIQDRLQALPKDQKHGPSDAWTQYWFIGCMLGMCATLFGVVTAPTSADAPFLINTISSLVAFVIVVVLWFAIGLLPALCYEAIYLFHKKRWHMVCNKRKRLLKSL